MNKLGKPITQRQLRVGEMIKQALGMLFIRDEAKLPNLSTKEITVTEVRMSPDLNTAKILSDGSLNTVYSVFQNSLQKGKKQKVNDESYQRFIDQNFAELGIKTSKYLVGSQSKSKKGLQFRDYSYEFTCNYSQLTNFLSILEGQEKLFKIDKLSIKNPITNYKNKEKANEIDVALTLSTVTLTRKKANNEQKK